MSIKENNEAINLLEKLKSTYSRAIFKHIEKIDKGLGFVLIYLFEHNDIGYANEIACKMNVSRARVAIIINKLENKKFIRRENNLNDKRIDVIRLTVLGKEEVYRMKNNALTASKTLIDNFGIDALNKYLSMTKKIHKILEDNLHD